MSTKIQIDNAKFPIHHALASVKRSWLIAAKIVFFVLLSGLLLLSCKIESKPQAVKRFGSITGLKPDKIAEYKALHANAWPAVLKKIKACNIKNYSIYLQKVNNEYFLFSYFEYTGDDFDEDMKKMAADSVTQRWWKVTNPCQQPLPETAAKNQIWTNMEEVFHTD